MLWAFHVVWYAMTADMVRDLFVSEMLKMRITYKKVYAKLSHIKNYMYLCNVIS